MQWTLQAIFDIILLYKYTQKYGGNMYNIKLDSYVPEPSPAHSDRIIAAHYYAAWKKGAAEIHEGFADNPGIFS